MSDASLVDEKYYQAVPSGSVSERILVAARNRIHADFLRLMQPLPNDRIIDVGVSDVISAGANVLERLYDRPDRITAVGLGHGMDFRAAYPQVGYRRIEPHVALPFADQSFDIACSNAVIEHLGSREYQVRFVSDLSRVARRVFLTVPNRLFPIEHHTALPFAGWTDRTFRLGCKAARATEWANPANLILMSRRRFATLCPPDRRARVGYTGFRLGPFSSNIYLCLDAD